MCRIKEGQKAKLESFCFLLTHKLTSYDRKQSSKPGYNVYALSHYMGAVSSIEKECKKLGIWDNTTEEAYLEFIHVMNEKVWLPPAKKLEKEIKAYIKDPRFDFSLV
jgi:hypothetical protein